MDLIINVMHEFVWGAPALVLIICVGIILTLKTNGAQFRLFKSAWKNFLIMLFGRNKKEDGVSSFQALCTALAATVGTGNIVGVAGAITLGGPGAIFWMWVSALIGMIIKATEVVLAVKFRKSGKDNLGGPMYVIKNALSPRWRWLAVIYSFFGIFAAFGMGNATQINAVLDSINNAANASGLSLGSNFDWIVGLVISCIVAIILLGGAKRTGQIAEYLIPFASIAYILICLFVVIARIQYLPGAIRNIFVGAFSPRSITAGAVSSMFICFRTGISRGVFTNEAGMGTASIAHAGANINDPVEQSLMGIVEVFLDTIVICTMTALAILCSGVVIDYGTDEGVLLTARAFSSVCGNWVNIILALFLCIFAFATMLGWGLYGIRCAQFLFGERIWKIIILFQVAIITLSTFLKTGTIWKISEILNGLMAIPNLIAIWILMPTCVRLFNDYKIKKERT